MDLKSLYQEILNEHNLNPTHKGVMENPTFTLQGVNPSCGDNIYLQLKIDDNGIIGKPKDEALRLASLFMDMIYGKVEDDDALEELDEAASLKNISKMPARVKCAVLGWHTMEEMLKNGKTAGQGSVEHCTTE